MALQTANQFRLNPNIASNLGGGVKTGQNIAGQFQLGKQRDQQIQQTEEDATVKRFLNSALELSAVPDDQKLSALKQNRAAILARGGETSDTDAGIALAESGDFETLNNEIQGIITNGERRGLIKPLAAGPSQFEQAKTAQVIAQTEQIGKPAQNQPFQKDKEGLVFNPNTGVFTVDKVAKARFDELASKANAGGSLDFKDKQGLNKDITAIIKGPITIRRSAEELEKLKGVGSAAAKLGAVFKFMKSLDPTSVVRESEQGQVYSASGAAAQLAGSINSLLGKGKLNESGFQDLVTTAKAIADANILSVGGEVSSLLDSFGETLPADFKAGIQNRIPEPFEITIDDLVNKYGTK
jgi:hypothetical protein